MDGKEKSVLDVHVDKPSILIVLKKLDSVFSGEAEYDVVFMELDLHLAQVRKEYPHLYAVLSNGARKQGADDSSLVAKELLSAIKNLRSSNPNEPFASLPTSSQPQAQEQVVNEPILAYTSWVTDQIKPRSAAAFKESDEWLVRWDIPNVPPPRVGEPLTIKNSDGFRLRFQVAEAMELGESDGTMVYRFTFLTIVKE